MGELVARLEWFEREILPHEPLLRARLRRMAPRSQDIEELTSEIMARAYAAAGWRDVEHGRAYLFRIARNLLVDASRRDKIVSFEVMAGIDLLQVDDRTRTGLEARDELRRVELAIDTLPIQCRRVFVLRRVYDYTVGEIAEEMGLSVSTVEKHLTKAISRMAGVLAQSWEQDFEEPLADQQRQAVDRRGSGSARP